MNRYRSYKFRNYDPILDRLEEVMYVNGLTKAEISRESGVSTTTLYNWQKRKTRSPNSATLNAALHVAGYELAITKIRD